MLTNSHHLVGRKGLVEAHQLQAEDLILCDDGVREIVRIERIAEPIRVYNLEVQGQHVYQVSSLGMLVHHVSPIGGDGASAALSSRDSYWLQVDQNTWATSASAMNDRMISETLRQTYARHHQLATDRIVEIMRRLANAPTSLN